MALKGRGLERNLGTSPGAAAVPPPAPDRPLLLVEETEAEVILLAPLASRSRRRSKTLIWLMDAPRVVGADGLGMGEFVCDLLPAPGRGLLPAFWATRRNGSGKVGHPLPPLPPPKTPDVPFSVVCPLTTAAASSAPPPHVPKMSARSGRMPQHPTAPSSTKLVPPP